MGAKKGFTHKYSDITLRSLAKGWMCGRCAEGWDTFGVSALPAWHRSECRTCSHLLCFLHHVFERQSKNQSLARERENCKMLFSISSWLPGLCAVAGVSMCEISAAEKAGSREYTRGLLNISQIPLWCGSVVQSGQKVKLGSQFCSYFPYNTLEKVQYHLVNFCRAISCRFS